MQLDLASRDDEFKEVTACMRRLMLDLLGNAEDYSVVPIQGGGSFAMEAALSSFVSRADRPLVCVNGIYGERILQIFRLWGVEALKCQSACKFDPSYCRICECYPDGAIADEDPMSINRSCHMAFPTCSTRGAVGGSGPT
ncbi:aspartate aminotransferase-like enzyme [Bradyrhizobium japonicum]